MDVEICHTSIPASVLAASSRNPVRHGLSNQGHLARKLERLSGVAVPSTLLVMGL